MLSTGIARPERRPRASAGADGLMGRYLLRRLLIAVPSLLGISIVLFTILALAPGDPFGELASNPAVPPEVRGGAARQVRPG